MPENMNKVAFDLSLATPAEIEKFRNLAIANVIRPVMGIDELSTHDRHYSNHSKDKAQSFLLSADEVSFPRDMFDKIEGAKEMTPEEFTKRLR